MGGRRHGGNRPRFSCDCFGGCSLQPTKARSAAYHCTLTRVRCKARVPIIMADSRFPAPG